MPMLMVIATKMKIINSFSNIVFPYFLYQLLFLRSWKAKPLRLVQIGAIKNSRHLHLQRTRDNPVIPPLITVASRQPPHQERQTMRYLIAITGPPGVSLLGKLLSVCSSRNVFGLFLPAPLTNRLLSIGHLQAYWFPVIAFMRFIISPCFVIVKTFFVKYSPAINADQKCIIMH